VITGKLEAQLDTVLNTVNSYFLFSKKSDSSFSPHKDTSRVICPFAPQLKQPNYASHAQDSFLATTPLPYDLAIVVGSVT
jgi:hypothetical protein